LLKLGEVCFAEPQAWALATAATQIDVPQLTVMQQAK
jgi:hypothetical protein